MKRTGVKLKCLVNYDSHIMVGGGGGERERERERGGVRERERGGE